MKNIVVFGAAGHGSVVLDCIEQEGKYNVVGFVDSSIKKGKYHCGYEVLGNEYDLPYLVEKFNLHGGLIAIGDNWKRKLMVDKILEHLPIFNFVSAVHPRATIGKNVHIGAGTVIVAGTIVNANSWIGNHCILNTLSSLGHDGRMEDYSSLAPKACAAGNLVLGRFSAVCIGANIIEKITIGRHTVIGGGALVINDVESHVVSYGLPAKKIRERKVGDPYLNRNKETKVASFTANNY